jgi:hypothetical protein
MATQTRPVPQIVNADFAIEVEFAPNTPDPARVFRSMTHLIDSFQYLDSELVKSIDVSLRPITLLEDIQSGSVRAWLKHVIESTDDTALIDGDWKKLVGRYLYRAKYSIIRFLDGKSSIASRDEVLQLEGELLGLAEESGVKRIPYYAPISSLHLLRGIERINHAVHDLGEGDRAHLLTKDGERVDFNLTFNISPAMIEDLLVKERITNQNLMILRVKKPDYLGLSMWEFDGGIEAKIIDTEWLMNFQNRKIDVRPGDALRANVDVEVHYGFDGTVVGMAYRIVRVLEVMHPPDMGQHDLLSD